MSAAHKTNPKLCELPSVMQLISIFQVDEINSTYLIDKLTGQQRMDLRRMRR